jgi:lipopolysaccharide transport system permease protein
MLKNTSITIYESNQRHKTGIFATWLLMIKNIVNSRELIFQLFVRDFFMSYKKSFLGWSWIFLSPIVGVISWIFMNATGVLTPGNVGIPYPAYVLLSTSIWGLFMSFYGSAKGTLSAGTGFVMQVKYPHEALLIHQTLMAFSNFIISFIITIAFLFAFGVYPHWKIIFFPLLVLPLFFLGAAIGLIISVVAAVSTDFNKAFDVVFSLTLYVTPVIYSPTTANPALEQIVKYNPLTYLICTIRDIIIYGKSDYFFGYLIVSAVALLLFIISWRIFYISEDMVIEKMI